MPKVTVKKSLIDSLSGISVGVNGFVVASEMRVMLGLGIPAVNAGPYARMVASLGVTVGSDLGIVKCRQATVVLTAGTGVGLSMSDTVASGVNYALKELGVTKKLESDTKKDVYDKELFNKSDWVPDKPICRSG
jgi:hypothetical protein